MPTPKKGESEKDFVARCIPYVMKEDDKLSQKQAAGKCYGIYRQGSSKRDISLNDMMDLIYRAWGRGPGSSEGDMPWSYPIHIYQKYVVVRHEGIYYKVPYTYSDGTVAFGSPSKVELEFRQDLVRRVMDIPIRAEGGGAPGVYRAYGVLFGTEKEKDLYGTFFDAETKLHLDWYDRRPWLYDHGSNPMIGRSAVGFWEEHGEDDLGVFFRGELNKRHRYIEAIEALLDGEHLYPSQGTARHLMHVAENGHVDEWGLVEISSTPAPGNYRQQPVTEAAIRAFRLLGGIDMPGDGEELQSGLLEEMEPDVLETPEEAPQEEAEEEEPESLNADEVLRAFTAIDKTLKELHGEVAALRREVTALKKTDAEKVKDVATGRSVLSSLWSVSRSGDDVATEEDQPEAPPLISNVGARFGGLLAEVMGDGGLVGGSRG